MIGAAKRRRYRTAAAVALGSGFGVALDGKPLHTPGRAPMVLPASALAEAVAAEWQSQSAEIDPLAMPLTRLAGSAIDLVAPRRAEIAARTAAYGESDLLCYRAEGPEELALRQAASWQPILDWAVLRYGAALRVTAGVLPVAQPEAAVAALRVAVEALDDMRLAALAAATAACGSLLLALALVEGEIDAEAAWRLSQLDESYQAELWGEDAEAAQKRAALKADIATAARFLALLAG